MIHYGTRKQGLPRNMNARMKSALPQNCWLRSVSRTGPGRYLPGCHRKAEEFSQNDDVHE